MLNMLGGFSEEALLLFQLAASEQAYEFSEEGETYDFTRCMRPDGTFYGTGGTCKKGSVAGAKEKETPRQKRNREDLESPKNKADMDHVGLMKLMAKSPTAQRQLREEAKAKAGKPRATANELRDQQRALFDTAKARRAEAKAAEKEYKAIEKETKGDTSKEAKKRRLEAGRKWDKAGTAADRAQSAWEKAHTRWSKASERENRAKMSPAQRAEARRVDKIIKERG